MENMFERGGPLRPGDVVLGFAGPMPIRRLLGAWLTEVAGPARAASAEVPVLVIGLASSIMEQRSAAALVAQLQKDWGGKLPAVEVVELKVEEAESCLRAFPFARPNAVVVLLDAERLRFGGIDREGPVVEMPDGAIIRLAEKDALAQPHVERLCLEICKAATVAGQKWLILSRGYGFGTLPLALQGLGNLDIFQLAEDGDEARRTKEFQELLGMVKTMGPEPALQWIAENLPNAKIAAVARANVLSLADRPVAAYQEIASVAEAIIEDRLPEEILQLAQMALAAGQIPEARKWLQHLPAAETLQWENLRAARLLAQQLNDEALWQDCRRAFDQRFSHEPLVQLDRFNELLGAKEYAKATEFAAETGHPFRAEVAKFLSDPAQSPAALLQAADTPEAKAEAHWILAKSASQRKEYLSCRQHALQLAEDEERRSDAMALFARALGAQSPEIDEGEFRGALETLLRWCAVHPAELKPRYALEALFENTSTARECLAITAGLLAGEIERLAKAFDMASIPREASLDADCKPASKSGTIAFMTGLLEPNRGRPLVVGTARVSPEWMAKINPSLWATFRLMLNEATDSQDTDTAKLCLHAVMGLARAKNDPASDLLAAWQVTGLLSASHNPQDALDLMEGLLVQLPANQAAHKQGRLSAAWLCYANVSQRLHNIPAALRYLYFACVTESEKPLYARLFLNYFRVAARVARDMRVTPLALRCLELERGLIGASHEFKRRLRELAQMELSVLLAEWRPGDGPEAILGVATAALDLLDQCEPREEIAPLVSVAAQALQFYGMIDDQAVVTAQERLKPYVARLPKGPREIVQTVLVGRISSEKLRTLATRSVRSSADWTLALKPATVGARHALAQAVETADAELFWTACLILCQPGLGVRVSETKTAPDDSDPITGTKWMAKQIEAGRNPVDAVLNQRAMSNAPTAGIGGKLFEVSLQDFLDGIDEDETVVLLAIDNANVLFRCELRRGATSPPMRVSAPEWDYERFRVWSQEYPSKYGSDLKLYFGHLREPPPAEVRATLAGLLPAGMPMRRLTTVVAEGRLFSFTHRLAADLAGNGSSVSVCPSALWLAMTRRQAVSAPGKVAAWLGTPKAEDLALEFLHAHLPAIFQRYHIPLNEERALPTLPNHGFVVLGAHGGARNHEGFVRLADGVNEYEPDQVAARLANTACVVLFVCHGGRGDEGLYSHETSGLTSSLLRQGVRAVVAALWPLDAALAVTWLEEFALTDPKETLALRVDEAQRKMAQRTPLAEKFGEHPLVRSAFTVFGDGSIKVPFPG